MQKYVPVVSNTGKPLMPTTNKKANKLIEKGRAIRHFNRGLFYIQLIDRADGYTQPIAVGVDPGSKKEGFSVKSKSATYLNIQTDAVTWVKESESVSTLMRRSRRNRKTPYRKLRKNRNINQISLPPSTKSRWQWKLRVINWIAKIYPITVFVVEDISAQTKPYQRRWNESFSSLEVGKHWFYVELTKIAPVGIMYGFETKLLRDTLGLKKTKNKLSDRFEAHVIDAWVLANQLVGGHISPDNKAIMYIVPLRFYRRQLHAFQTIKGGKRRPYGGTRSFGFKRGSWVKHPQYGVCYIGGASIRGLSLHNLQDGQRLTQRAKPEDCQFLTFASWRLRKEQAHSTTASKMA